jgi:hypothetical protein
MAKIIEVLHTAKLSQGEHTDESSRSARISKTA